MNRKLVGGSIVVVLALVAAWFLWLRGGDDEPAAKPVPVRTGEVKPVAPVAKRDDAPAPQMAAPRWALDLDREGPLRLEGQVIGPDGAGVANAEVWLGSVPPRTATTEDDGTFAFDKLAGRTYALAAKAGALIGGPVQYKLTDQSDPVVIRVAEGARVIATVVDEAKRPLPGVTVRVGAGVESTSTTDDKGEATVTPVSPGYVVVQAEATGYAPGNAFAMVGSSGSTGRVSITLRKGFAIAGRVVDEAGKPVAKARVSIGGGSDFAYDFDGTTRKDPSVGTTDAKGQFTIAAVAAGTHTLTAIDGEHAPARSAPVTVHDRPVSGVEITMQVGGVLAGVVVDGTKQPVPYASVRVAGAADQMMRVMARQATTDAKGAFELRGLARTTLQARAESEQAASRIADVDLRERREHRDLELVLDVTGTISGVVVDGSGAPVAEVQVNAFPDILGGASTDGLALAGMSSATTNGDGGFTITGLPDGSYRLWAARSASMSAGWGRENTQAKTGDKNVRITLAAPGGIKGTIELVGGGAPKLASVGAGWQAPTPADRDGHFELKDLAPGPYDVTFRGPEFAVMVKRDVTVEPGKTLDLGTVTVHRGRRVAGKVVDAKGRAVAGAKVKLGEMIVFQDDGSEADDGIAEDMGFVRSATTDQDGAFAIVGVPSKPTSIAADHASGRSVAIAIPGGAQDPPPLTLTLRGFGTIAGKVVQKGAPVPNATITQTSKAGGAQLAMTKTDDTGTFTMKKVPEGPIVLQVMQQQMMSMKSTSVTAHVTAGKETKVTIDIPVGELTLVVDLRPAAGAQVDAAQVFLYKGTASPANGKELMDSFVAGGSQGMKFWFGPGKPLPQFDELVPGDYSACTIPITGSMNDPQFMQRLQENIPTLKVYCRKTTLAPTPQKQTLVQEVPAMTPLPAPQP